jgi:hypothetical protein
VARRQGFEPIRNACGALRCERHPGRAATRPSRRRGIVAGCPGRVLELAAHRGVKGRRDAAPGVGALTTGQFASSERIASRTVGHADENGLAVSKWPIPGTTTRRVRSPALIAASTYRFARCRGTKFSCSPLMRICGTRREASCSPRPLCSAHAPTPAGEDPPMAGAQRSDEGAASYARTHPPKNSHCVLAAQPTKSGTALYG